MSRAVGTILIAFGAAPAGQDAGRIAEIGIEEGQWVETGDIVAVLGTAQCLEAAGERAEATLTSAMELQEAQWNGTRWEFDRLRQLQKSGIHRENTPIDERLAHEGSELALASAGVLLERNGRRDSDGIRIDEVSARAEVAVAEATATLRPDGAGRMEGGPMAMAPTWRETADGLCLKPAAVAPERCAELRRDGKAIVGYRDGSAQFRLER